MKTTIDAKRMTQNLLKSLSEKQYQAMGGLLEVVKTLTPEDTGLMLDSYGLMDTEYTGFISTTGITNTAVSNKGYQYPWVVDQ